MLECWQSGADVAPMALYLPLNDSRMGFDLQLRYLLGRDWRLEMKIFYNSLVNSVLVVNVIRHVLEGRATGVAFEGLRVYFN